MTNLAPQRVLQPTTILADCGKWFGQPFRAWPGSSQAWWPSRSRGGSWVRVHRPRRPRRAGTASAPACRNTATSRPSRRGRSASRPAASRGRGGEDGVGSFGRGGVGVGRGDADGGQVAVGEGAEVAGPGDDLGDFGAGRAAGADVGGAEGGQDGVGAAGRVGAALRPADGDAGLPSARGDGGGVVGGLEEVELAVDLGHRGQPLAELGRRDALARPHQQVVAGRHVAERGLPPERRAVHEVEVGSGR